MVPVRRIPVGWLVGGVLAAAAALLGLLLLLEPAWANGLPARVGSPGFVPLSAQVVGPVLVLLLGLVVLLGNRVRRAEAAEAKLRLVLDSLKEGVLIIDDDGRIASANPPAEAMFGYAPGELIGRPVDPLLPSGFLSDSAPSGPPSGSWAGDFVGRRKDGSELTLDITSGPSLPIGGTELTPLVLRDVTKTRRMKEMLSEREAHLRLVVEQMPAILWTTDRSLKITSSMGGGLAALNLNPTEVIGMTMLEHLDRESLECTPIAAHLAALEGRSLSYEMEWKGRTFQVRVDPLRNRVKQITGTIGIVVDVTDHKQTVAELKARAAQQAAVADLGQRALGGEGPGELMDDAAGLVRQNLGVEFCQVLEALPDGQGLRWRAGAGWRLAPGEVPAQPVGTNTQAGFTLLSEGPVVTEDLGRETRFQPAPLLRDHGVVSAVTVVIPGKRGPFGVLGAYTTSRRRFREDELHFLQAVANVLATALERHQAEEAQGRLVTILEATTDCVATASKDLRVLYLNRAGRSLLDVAPGDKVADGPVAELYAEESRKALLNEVIPTAVCKGAWSGEAVLARRGGDKVAVSQVVLAHKATGGEVEFFSIIARDVTERRRLEEQLRQAQKMEAVGRLAGGIAHDFNNLLTVITGYSEFLMAGLPPGGEAHEQAREIQRAGERAAGLTRQLLAFGRKQMLRPQVLNLNTLIINLQKMLRRLIGEDVELATCLDPTLHPVEADPGQMEQILMNLVVNARDAMPQGGKLTVRTANARLGEDYARRHPEVRPGPYARLEVRDTGHGMNAEVQAHLFEPFFTTKGVGKGTGLGLATVYGIVKQSGGHIEVDSAPGRGAAFTIYLPCVPGRPAPPEPAGPGTPAPRGKETVLLVEDEDGVRALARQTLRDSGYTVLEARHGEEALAVYEQRPGPIDLLLTDVVMPRLGGGTLARRLAEQCPGLKVLFMSGYTDSDLIRRGVLAGDVECLLKPFTPEDLAWKVREVLDQPAASPAGQLAGRR